MTQERDKTIDKHQEQSLTVRQQPDYTENVNMALANLAKQKGADVTRLNESSAAQQSEARVKQSQTGDEMGNKAFQNGKQDVFEQAYDLYQKQFITKVQFLTMTGISPK